MDFALFLLLNAVLFLRPAEIVPGLLGWPIYEVVILACLAAAFPAVLRQLGGAALAARPVTLCVLGLAAAVVLSHLARFATYDAREYGLDFAKTASFYLLLVGIVATPGRLKRFLVALPAFAAVIAALAVLVYHGKLDIPAMAPAPERWGDVDGDEVELWRLCGSGIFNDPNDLSLLLVASVVLCAYHLANPTWPVARWAWLAPLALFGYALTLTQSRGGFLALVASLLVLLARLLGWRRCLPVAAVVVPALFLVFGGRQTDLSTADGTGQDRIRLWSEGLSLFHETPLFGIGRGMMAEETGYVAHNSFVHAYVELGVFGGTLFLGAFGLAALSLLRLKGGPGLLRARPYLLAVVAGYATGMLTLSRCYVVPTYLILGLATAYGRVVAENAAPLPLSGRLVARLGAASVAFLVATEVFVRLFANRG